MLVRVALLTLLLISSCVPAAHAQPREKVWQRTKSGAPIRWKPTSLPLILVLHPSLLHWQDDLVLAADFWNRAVMRHPVFIVMPPTDLPVSAILPGEGPVMILGHKSNDTRLWAVESSGELLAAMVGVEPAEGRPWARYLILIHELGHVLGLAHDDPAVDPHSLMVDTVTSADIDRLRVEPEDVAALWCWYMQVCREPPQESETKPARNSRDRLEV